MVSARTPLQWGLIGLVWLYLGWLLGLPIATLVWHGLGAGVGPFVATLFRPDVAHAFRVTLVLALGAVALNTVFGVALAWVLVRQRFRGQGVVNALIDLPFAVSPVVAGYMLILLFGRNGWARGLTDGLGIQVAFALPGMLLATTFVSLPFVVREVGPVLAQLGRDQEEAARTLGASAWTTFWRVTLPGIRWGVLYGVSLTLARALGEFGAVFVVGAAVIGSTETATVFIFRALDGRETTAAYTVSIALIGVSLLLLTGIEGLRARARAEGDG